MAFLFLGLLGLVLLALLFQRLETVETKVLSLTIKWTVVGVLILTGIYLTLTGRLLHVAVIVIFIVMLLQKDTQQWFAKPSPPKQLTKPMTKKEAAEILGVSTKASPQEIEGAYKQRMKDKGISLSLLEEARNKLNSKH